MPYMQSLSLSSSSHLPLLLLLSSRPPHHVIRHKRQAKRMHEKRGCCFHTNIWGRDRERQNRETGGTVATSPHQPE